MFKFRKVGWSLLFTLAKDAPLFGSGMVKRLVWGSLDVFINVGK